MSGFFFGILIGALVTGLTLTFGKQLLAKLTDKGVEKIEKL